MCLAFSLYFFTSLHSFQVQIYIHGRVKMAWRKWKREKVDTFAICPFRYFAIRIHKHACGRIRRQTVREARADKGTNVRRCTFARWDSHCWIDLAVRWLLCMHEHGQTGTKISANCCAKIHRCRQQMLCHRQSQLSEADRRHTHTYSQTEKTWS